MGDVTGSPPGPTAPESLFELFSPDAYIDDRGAPMVAAADAAAHQDRHDDRMHSMGVDQAGVSPPPPHFCIRLADLPGVDLSPEFLNGLRRAHSPPPPLCGRPRRAGESSKRSQELRDAEEATAVAATVERNRVFKHPSVEASPAAATAALAVLPGAAGAHIGAAGGGCRGPPTAPSGGTPAAAVDVGFPAAGAATAPTAAAVTAAKAAAAARGVVKAAAAAAGAAVAGTAQSGAARRQAASRQEREATEAAHRAALRTLPDGARREAAVDAAGDAAHAAVVASWAASPDGHRLATVVATIATAHAEMASLRRRRPLPPRGQLRKLEAAQSLRMALRHRLRNRRDGRAATAKSRAIRAALSTALAAAAAASACRRLW